MVVEVNRLLVATFTSGRGLSQWSRVVIEVRARSPHLPRHLQVADHELRRGKVPGASATSPQVNKRLPLVTTNRTTAQGSDCRIGTLPPRLPLFDTSVRLVLLASRNLEL